MPKFISSELSRLIRARSYVDGNLAVTKRDLEFVRLVEEALTALKLFWKEHNEDYTRFNYVGERHSHPQFPEYPRSQG